jgi:hypothetical protein
MQGPFSFFPATPLLHPPRSTQHDVYGRALKEHTGCAAALDVEAGVLLIKGTPLIGYTQAL